MQSFQPNIVWEPLKPPQLKTPTTWLVLKLTGVVLTSLKKKLVSQPTNLKKTPRCTQQVVLIQPQLSVISLGQTRGGDDSCVFSVTEACTARLFFSGSAKADEHRAHLLVIGTGWKNTAQSDVHALPLNSTLISSHQNGIGVALMACV